MDKRKKMFDEVEIVSDSSIDSCRCREILEMDNCVGDNKVLNSNINAEDRSSILEDDENVKPMNDTDKLSFRLEMAEERDVAILKEYHELQDNTLVVEKRYAAKMQQLEKALKIKTD